MSARGVYRPRSIKRVRSGGAEAFLEFIVEALAGSNQADPTKRGRATRAEVEARREALFEIVSEQQPMTVRQVFYQATVRSVIEKTEKGYTKVQTDLVLMRRSGELPYSWLADATRWMRKPTTFGGIEEALRDCAAFYRKACGATSTLMPKFGSKKTRWRVWSIRSQTPTMFR